MGVLLLVLGAFQIYEAATRGGWWSLLAWSGAAFSLVGAAHLASAPRFLGKRADGRIDGAHLLALLPYFLVTWGRWQIEWLLSRENAWDEVAPGLFLGRWPGRGGLPGGIRLVVDMTAELPEPSWVTRGREYVCLPTFDTTTPDARPFAEVARRVAASPGPVYVHCALGHGRSATLAAAVLLCRGIAGSVPGAVERLRTRRPRVRLGPAQRRLLEGFERELRGAAETPSHG